MLEAVIFALSAVGALLLGVLALRISAANAQIKLAKHRSKDAGFADLLNYAAMVDDGVIACKSGAFLAAWLYEADDNASTADEQRELVAARINQALARLGNGWMLHIDAARRAAPGYPAPQASHFPDAVSMAIDEERRRTFESIGATFEGYFVLSVTYMPPSLAQQRFVELMFEDNSATPDDREAVKGLLEYFKRECDSLENRLSNALSLHRLKSEQERREDGSIVRYDELLRWLQFCATGLNHAVRLPETPVFLDKLVGGQEMWGGVVPRIGRNFVQVVGIDGFPSDSAPGILTALGEQPIEYRWSTRFIYLDQHEALGQLQNYQKKWAQRVRPFMDQLLNSNAGRFNQHASDMVADANGAITEIEDGLVAGGYYTANIVLMSPKREQVEASAAFMEKAINRLGFTARIETINTLDAFFGSLPGHGVENVRRPFLHTLNLADLIPTSTIWTGSDTAPCPMYQPGSPPLMHAVAQGATPFRFNLHVADLGHSVMLGPTRSGKSTKLALLALQALRYEGMTVFAFDKGQSMYATTKAVGGSHFVVAAESEALSFCPLQFLGTKGDLAWAMEWIDTVLKLNGINTTPAQRNEIGNAIVSMRDSGARTMSEFSLTIQDAVIREALKQYTVDGAMGHLLDAQEDGLALGQFTTFEIEDLLNLGEKYALPVLLYLFRRIEQSLRGQPALLLLDEAWIMLGHPAFRAKIREWLKAFAKKNCAVLLATQSLSDAANSGILDVIVESTATKIFLPNAFARDKDASELYRRMGLNDRQIAILATATPKRQYYAMSSAGRRLYELALGPLALAIVGATDLESIAAIKELERKFGEDWIYEWLKGKGLRLSDYVETERQLAWA